MTVVFSTNNRTRGLSNLNAAAASDEPCGSTSVWASLTSNDVSPENNDLSRAYVNESSRVVDGVLLIAS